MQKSDKKHQYVPVSMALIATKCMPIQMKRMSNIMKHPLNQSKKIVVITERHHRPCQTHPICIQIDIISWPLLGYPSLAKSRIILLAYFLVGGYFLPFGITYDCIIQQGESDK